MKSYNRYINVIEVRLPGFAFCNAEIHFLVLVIDGQRLKNFQDGFVWKFVFLTTDGHRFSKAAQTQRQSIARPDLKRGEAIYWTRRILTHQDSKYSLRPLIQ
jgi:hypothetical protein